MPEVEELDEQSLFNAAVSDEPETPATEVAEVPEKPEIEPEKPVLEAETPEAKPDSRIPEWRREEIAAEKNRAVDEAKAAREQLAMERSQREALQRELSALRPKEDKATKPDPLLDPEGYAKAVRDEIREEIITERRETSLANAHKTYKTEFEEAYAEAQKHVDPVLRTRMQNSRDPGETLIAWHRERKTQAEIGGDLTAYKQKMREESLKDPEFRKAAMEVWRNEASTQTRDGRPRIDMPPSMNGVSRTGALLKSSNDDVPDPDLWNEVTGTG